MGKMYRAPVLLNFEAEVHRVAILCDVLFALTDQARVAACPAGMSNTFPAPALLSESSTA